MAGDFIPHSDGAFLEWAKTLTAYAAAHLTAFNVPETALTPIQAQLTAYNTAFEAAQDPNRGKVDVLAKNKAKDALTATLRAFIKAYLAYNPAVTDADKKSMDLPLHDGARTPVPPPSTVPEAEAKTPYPMVVEIHFHDEGREKRGKPAGVHGAKIAYALLDTPPSTVEDLTRSAFDPRSPFTLNFEENQRGKALYFALHWENAKGQAGPWSVIQKAIVP
jgi:hypothetical protein